MKLLNILKEIITTPAFKAQIYKLEKEGYRRVGQGNWGMVLEKGNRVKKVTTDPDEIRHTQKLLGHTSPYIIPIFNLEKLSDNLAILDMPNAMELDNAEKDMIGQAGSAAEDYIVYDQEDALERIPEQLHSFVIGIKKAFLQAGIEPDEIDWSPYNVMKYKGKYVLVDV
jgi:hypothetical protein